MRATRVWLMSILFLLGLAPAGLAAAPVMITAAPDVRENLEYQITCRPVVGCGPGSSGSQGVEAGTLPGGVFRTAQGMWKLLSRWLPERYQTEMVYRDGRLKPVVY